MRFVHVRIGATDQAELVFDAEGIQEISRWVERSETTGWSPAIPTDPERVADVPRHSRCSGA